MKTYCKLMPFKESGIQPVKRLFAIFLRKHSARTNIQETFKGYKFLKRISFELPTNFREEGWLGYRWCLRTDCSEDNCEVQ